MKKVIANWLKKENKISVQFESFEEMIENNFFIGFVPKASTNKLMLVPNGVFKRIAVSPTTFWCPTKEQDTEDGEYFVFESRNELLEWMKY